MKYEIGQSASRTKSFTNEDVQAFAKISGDNNPLHLDDDYAATTSFGRRIAHGILTASLISAILANDLPGPGTIYLGQNLKFKKPVFIGDTVTATVTIRETRPDKNILYIDTVCTNQNGQKVIEGDAVVLAPKDV